MPASKSRKNAKPHRPRPGAHDLQPLRRSAPAEPTPVTDKKFAPQTWGKSLNAAIIELDVPSGQTCLVRTVGIPGLMAAGILNHVDGLTALVDKKYLVNDEAGGKPKIDARSLANDSDALETVFSVINKVVCYCVVEPKVEPVPTYRDSNGVEHEDISPDSRVEGVVYVDTVPEEDQMFIFNAVTGGTRDLERFRQLANDALGGVGIGEDMGVSAE